MDEKYLDTNVYLKSKSMWKSMYEEDYDPELRKAFFDWFEERKIDLPHLLKHLKETAYNMGTSPHSIIFVYTKWEEKENPFQTALDYVYKKYKPRFQHHHNKNKKS